MVMCSTGMYKVKVHVGQSQVVNHAIRARYCENASKHHFPPGADYRSGTLLAEKEGVRDGHHTSDHTSPHRTDTDTLHAPCLLCL